MPGPLRSAPGSAAGTRPTCGFGSSASKSAAGPGLQLTTLRSDARRFTPGDATEHRDARQAVQREAAGGLARTEESRYRLAAHVEYLASRVDVEARQRVVKNRRRPRRVERRLLDLEHQARSPELRILAGVHVRVVSRDRVLERARRHRRELIGIGDLPRELRDGAGAEEPAVRIDVRRFRVPLLAHDRIGVEDGPDRAAAVQLLALRVGIVPAET